MADSLTIPVKTDPVKLVSLLVRSSLLVRRLGKSAIDDVTGEDLSITDRASTNAATQVQPGRAPASPTSTFGETLSVRGLTASQMNQGPLPADLYGIIKCIESLERKHELGNKFDPTEHEDLIARAFDTLSEVAESPKENERKPKDSRSLLSLLLSLLLNKELDRGHVRALNNVLTSAVRYRRLQILCRYGDYLAERLKTLRQYIDEKKLDSDPPVIRELWTDTAATLQDEAEQDHNAPRPCHTLIQTAARGLAWDEKTTFFMVHEYAKRNNLMHAELFQLVDEKNWKGIGDRCETDLAKLKELFISSGQDDRDAINHWELIIMDFRNRWVRASVDESAWATWQARPIIQEAMNAGLDDRSSLNKLAMLPNSLSKEDREKAINALKEENNLKEKQREQTFEKQQKQADSELRKENRQLQRELDDLRKTMELRGTRKEVLESLAAEQKENRKLQNRIKKFNQDGIKNQEAVKQSIKRRRAFKRALRELEVEKHIIEEAEKRCDGEKEIGQERTRRHTI